MIQRLFLKIRLMIQTILIIQIIMAKTRMIKIAEITIIMKILATMEIKHQVIVEAIMVKSVHQMRQEQTVMYRRQKKNQRSLKKIQLHIL